MMSNTREGIYLNLLIFYSYEIEPYQYVNIGKAILLSSI